MTRDQAAHLQAIAITLTQLHRYTEARRALQALEIFTQWLSMPQFAEFVNEHLLWKPLAQACHNHPQHCQPIFSPRLLFSSDFWALRLPTLTIASSLPIDIIQTYTPVALTLVKLPYTPPLITIAHEIELYNIPRYSNGTQKLHQ